MEIITAAERTMANFFNPIQDADAPKRCREGLAKARTFATRLGLVPTAPLGYRVRPGFTVKQQAPKTGLCRSDFDYLQQWSFTDKATRDCFAFWIPRLLPESTNKTLVQQLAMIDDVSRWYDFPACQTKSLVDVTLTTGLMLAHYQATREKIPLESFWARTGTCRDGGGFRLNLGGFDKKVCCNGWLYDDKRSPDVGVFAIWVVELEN